jgi:ribosomal-protein-alanine N-acetyltransferase
MRPRPEAPRGVERGLPPLDVPLATPRLLLVPLTPALAEAALTGAALATPRGRASADPLPPCLVPAGDWPTDEAGVVLARAALAGDAAGQWLVALRSGLVVGECGLRAWAAPDEPEVGYGLAPSARGRGLATEAVGRLVEHLVARPGVRAVVARAASDNAASRRLLRRLGFTSEEGDPGPGPPGPGPAGAAVTYRRRRSP